MYCNNRWDIPLDLLKFLFGQTDCFFFFPLCLRSPRWSLQQVLPSWKEPIQIQRGDQSGDLKDARGPLLYLHIPGYQNSAQNCRGLPWLEVCGPSPGRLDSSAAGKRPYILQGVWQNWGLTRHRVIFSQVKVSPSVVPLSSSAPCPSGALRRIHSSCRTSSPDSEERRKARTIMWKAHGKRKTRQCLAYLGIFFLFPESFRIKDKMVFEGLYIWWLSFHVWIQVVVWRKAWRPCWRPRGVTCWS